MKLVGQPVHVVGQHLKGDAPGGLVTVCADVVSEDLQVMREGFVACQGSAIPLFFPTDATGFVLPDDPAATCGKINVNDFGHCTPCDESNSSQENDQCLTPIRVENFNPKRTKD
jgi:hypothetical protein